MSSMIDQSGARPSTTVVDSLHEIEGDVRSRYINRDIAPTRIAARTWSMKDVATLWISMCACVPTYMLASGLIAEGMNSWQAVLTIFLGNTIVLIPMTLNAHAGTKYGIPFPVYCRAAFGVRGANAPALLRALVACGWCGIQSWIGGSSMYRALTLCFPSLETMPKAPLGVSLPEMLCLLLFSIVTMWIIHKGIDSIRFLLNIKAPLIIALGLLSLAWAYLRAGGLGPLFDRPSAFAAGQPKEGQFFAFFVPALTAMVGGWATLSLSIPDFSRYSRSQRDHAIGQAIGLPITMGLFSLIGVAVTSGAAAIFGEVIWDPVVLATKFTRPVVVASLVCITIATLATNIAANVVSPANDFSHLWPSRVSFRAGGFIAVLLGILIQPWRLVADPSGYIFTWLVGYSALLGSIGGVLISDYHIIRHAELDLVGLYEGQGPYWYIGGWNPVALIALAAGVAPCLPGFLGTIHVAVVAAPWMRLYHYAWFVSFGISLASYAALTLGVRGMKARNRSRPSSRPTPPARPRSAAARSR
jgi:nucleobase:cation symporter-1, NCS1 family